MMNAKRMLSMLLAVALLISSAVFTPVLAVELKAEQAAAEEQPGDTAGVKITRQPESVTVAEGEMATVTVEAEGDGLTYAWYFSTVGDSVFYQTFAFTGNTYEVEMNEARSGRRLKCVISDRYGASVTTEVVVISMSEPVTELKITKQPESVTAAKGETVTVTVEAEGDGLTYEWYYTPMAGVDKFIPEESVVGNTYTLQMDPESAGIKVYCKVTDQYGNSEETQIVIISMLVEEFDYTVVNGTAAITGYNLDEANVVVLQILDDYAVTRIESGAFAGTGVTQVTLPKSIGFIAADAFDDPETVQIIAETGSYAYNWAVANGYIEVTVGPGNGYEPGKDVGEL